MGFVDGKKRQLAGFVEVIEQVEEARRDEALGGHVEHVERASEHGALDFHRAIEAEAGIEEVCRRADFLERADLILHQRDEGRHDNRHAGAQQRRDLVAQRFAAAGGHQHQGVAAGGYVFDDVFLRAAELRVAEDVE